MEQNEEFLKGSVEEDDFQGHFDWPAGSGVFSGKALLDQSIVQELEL
jgi:hypothetical protein